MQQQGLSRETLEQALAGQDAALRMLIDRLTPVIQSRVARTLLRRGAAAARDLRQDVQDYTQEILMGLFADGGRVLQSWEPERGLSAENFVGLVAERQTLSMLRSGKRNPWREAPASEHDLERASSEPGPEVQAMSEDTLARLLERLRERLTPLGWHLFDLLYLQELSVAETGRTAGLSADAVYAWRSRLRRSARQAQSELMSEMPATGRIP